MRWGTLALALAVAPASADVVAFTLASIPVEADGAAVHELDARDRLAAALGAGLPDNPERALAEVRRRLASPAGRLARERIAGAAAGNALAAWLGIERLPAVVVEGRYVVYGVPDVRRARGLVAAWRRLNERLDGSGTGVPAGPAGHSFRRGHDPSPTPEGRAPARSRPGAAGGAP